MTITMVKKRLSDGSECRKCGQVTQLLKQRGYWDRIDEVVWADERQPQSPGLQLAAKHGVDTAPFFIVHEGGRESVYTSAIQFMQACFQHAPSLLEQMEEQSRTQPDDLGLP